MVVFLFTYPVLIAYHSWVKAQTKHRNVLRFFVTLFSSMAAISVMPTQPLCFLLNAFTAHFRFIVFVTMLLPPLLAGLTPWRPLFVRILSPFVAVWLFAALRRFGT